MEKNNGPRFDPCGVPILINSSFEVQTLPFEFILTLIVPIC